MTQDLAPSVQEIADVIGRDKAIHLIRQMPSTGKRSWRVCFYVPAELSRGHWLVDVLGWDDASKLSRVFGGEILQPSNCRNIERGNRNERIYNMVKRGEPISHAAAVCGVSERRVTQLLAKRPHHERVTGAILRHAKLSTPRARTALSDWLTMGEANAD